MRPLNYQETNVPKRYMPLYSVTLTDQDGERDHDVVTAGELWRRVPEWLAMGCRIEVHPIPERANDLGDEAVESR
jgi:hypothetical protein